eukprot:7262618-Prymnesium_polylepis.1
MAEAEAAAEAEAVARGEAPFLVADAALVDGLSGGPLIDGEGSLVGLITRVLSAGGETKVYAVAARRVARAVESSMERRALGEQVAGVRVVLLNDGVNKRERVAAVLAAAGLSEQAKAANPTPGIEAPNPEARAQSRRDAPNLRPEEAVCGSGWQRAGGASRHALQHWGSHPRASSPR